MKFFEKGELKLLWPFYLEYLLASSIYFMAAFIVVYFSSIGFSAFQMSILFSVWSLSSLIFEIPTGAFADVYGRKNSVLIGYFLEALVMLSLFFWKDFKLMLLSFIVLGFASTFSSGSKDAWIVDNIKKKDKKLIHRFFNKMQFFISFGSIFSGILGAIMVKNFGISIIWIASFLSYILSISLLFFFAKDHFTPKKIKTISSLEKLKQQSKQSLDYSLKHHVLFYLIFAGMIAALSLNLCGSIARVQFLKDLGMNDYYFGYFWSITSLIMALSPVLSLIFLKKGKEKKFIVFALILWVLSIASVLFANNLILGLIIILLGSLFYCSKNPSEEVYFHRYVPSRLRATIGSLKNMTTSLAIIIILPIEGLLVDSIGARLTIFISAIIMIPAIILYLKIKENKSSAS
jgi:MFS family permease